jgi:hypothetical protein
MPSASGNISNITINSSTQVFLEIAPQTSPYPDLDTKGNQIPEHNDDVIFGNQNGQSVQYPGAANSISNCLSIEVTGLSTSLAGSVVILKTSNSLPVYLQSAPLTLDTSGGNAVFSVSAVYQTGISPTTPWCFTDSVNFSLYTTQDSSQTSPIFEQVIPMEFYVLPNTLPSCFDQGESPEETSDPLTATQKILPLLLLRMFVQAATARNIKTTNDWIALVVNICHGSATPVDGLSSQTEDHWLKYDSFHGDPSFIEANGEQLPGMQYFNYGGSFKSAAWLDAYRNFQSQGVLTLVNCYDQAAAVEVALSLGMDYNKLAWEYHRKFGFISQKTKTKLVGWGLCNSPYFKQIKANKVVEEQSTARTWFNNHAFLSWSPDFDWSNVIAGQEGNPDLDIGVTMYAIDACAGPHLGNEPRGVWVDPAQLPPNYADGSTYWTSRDDDYNHKEFDTNKELLNPQNNHNVWTPGITQLSDDPVLKRSLMFPDKLFDSSKIAFPAPTTATTPQNVMGGSFTSLKALFQTSLPSITPTWLTVPIADISVNNKMVKREFKVYNPNMDPFSYYSLMMTVTINTNAALQAIKDRASQIIITSTLEEEDFQAQSPTANTTQNQIFMLQADYVVLIQCLNIMVEIRGYADKTTVQHLGQVIANQLLNCPTVDSSTWKAILQ